MGKSSKVDLYAAIRRGYRGGLTLRALQRKYNVTWRTVRQAVDGQWRSRASSAGAVSRGWTPTSPD